MQSRADKTNQDDKANPKPTTPRHLINAYLISLLFPWFDLRALGLCWSSFSLPKDRRFYHQAGLLLGMHFYPIKVISFPINKIGKEQYTDWISDQIFCRCSMWSNRPERGLWRDYHQLEFTVYLLCYHSHFSMCITGERWFHGHKERQSWLGLPTRSATIQRQSSKILFRVGASHPKHPILSIPS